MINALIFLFLSPLYDSSATAVVISSTELFQSALCFSTTPTGRLFVIDQKKESLFQLSENGKIEKSIGGQGWGNYEFDFPTDVSSSFLLDIYVTDYNNRRIQRYDARLNFVQTIDENSLPSIGRFYPRASALSSLGDLFVVETDGKRILKLNKRYQLEKEFGSYKDGAGAIAEPKDIAISQSDEIFVLDGKRIVVFDIFGNFIRSIELTEAEWKSVQVSGNYLVVTSTHSISLFLFDGSGKLELPRSSFIGISSNDDFVDATLREDQIFLLTTSTLYVCSIH